MPKPRFYTKFHCCLLVIIGMTACASNSAAQQDENLAGGGEQNVVRGFFSTAIIDREPVDQVLILSNDVSEVFFFTELQHMAGQTVTHQWRHDGKTVSEKKFEVAGARWRVYSKRTLSPNMTGEWVVVVKDARGWPLYVAKFNYIEQQPGEESSAILSLE